MPKNMSLVTKDSLQAMLDNNNPNFVMTVVGKALSQLLKRQTYEERNVNATVEHNNIGFTGGDGRSGTLTAKYWLKHKALQEWMVERWTKRNDKGYSRLSKYWKQLNEIAEAKQSLKEKSNG